MPEKTAFEKGNLMTFSRWFAYVFCSYVLFAVLAGDMVARLMTIGPPEQKGVAIMCMRIVGLVIGSFVGGITGSFLIEKRA